MNLRRIFPEPAGEASLDDLYGVARQRVAGRPWVGICMVASLDGATVVEGRSGGLSNPQDAAVLARLREAADVIIVGAATVRQESYGPPRKAGQRIGVVTATGGVNPEGKLFASGAGFLIMPEDGPPTPAGTRGSIETVRAGVGQVDLPLALERLSDVVDAPSFVQCEGGPRLNGSLLDADCVDELDLTVSPVLAGGASPRVTAGAAPTVAGFSMAHVAIDNRSFVYTRWIRQR